MTSSSTFPQRLTKIDDLIRPDHSYLTDVDSCYFLGEYTARKGYAFSPGNNCGATIRMRIRIASPRNVASDTAVASFKMFPCLMLMLPLPHRATNGT